MLEVANRFRASNVQRIHKDRKKPRFLTRAHGQITPMLREYLAKPDGIAVRIYFAQKWDNEDTFQIDLLEILYAITAEDFEAIHVPNGGLRHMSVARRMKALGTRAGVFDLRCTWRGGDGELELKDKDGALSPPQREYGTYLTSIGKNNAVVRRVCDAVAKLREWGAPITPQFAGIAEMVAS